MQKIIIYFMSILFVIISNTCVYSGALGEWIGGMLGTDNYHNGPKDIQRQNKIIEEAMQERQKRIDQENKQKRIAEEEQQKRIDEFEQEKRNEYEKKEAAMQKLYFDEYANNESFLYIVSAKDYDEILKNFSSTIIDIVNKSSKITITDESKFSNITSKITKENFAITAIIYKDLNSCIQILDGILNSANKDDNLFKKSTPTVLDKDGDHSKKSECVNSLMNDYYSEIKSGKILSTFESNRKVYNEALINCGINDVPVELSLKNSKIYNDILFERKRLNILLDEVYKYSYEGEKIIFKKNTGFSFYGQEENLDDSLSNFLLDPQWKPETGYLYNLMYMEALQTISGGILITQNIPTPYNKVVFLDTNINFVDGLTLDGYYAYYIGNHKYQSLTGSRNVYAFKLFQNNGNQILKGRQFYFYPKVLDISAIAEKVISDAFGILSK